jgi:hypothetical protein
MLVACSGYLYWPLVVVTELEFTQINQLVLVRQLGQFLGETYI